MKTLYLYIYRDWQAAITVVLAALMAIFLLFTIASELGDTNQHYSTIDAVAGTFLRIPHFFQTLLPIAILTGTCVALTRISYKHELEIIISAGARPLVIARMLLLRGWLPLMLLAMANNELLVPWSYNIIQKLEQQPGQASQVANIWLNRDTRHIRVGETGDSGYLRDISIFSYNTARQLINVEHAEYAINISGNWKLFTITGHNIGETIEDYTVNDRSWDLNLPPAEFVSARKWDAARSLPEIWHNVKYETDQRYISVLWQRVSYPLLLALMLFLGVILVKPGSKNYMAVGKAMILLVTYFALQGISNKVATATPDTMVSWLVVATPLAAVMVTTAFLYHTSRS